MMAELPRVLNVSSSNDDLLPGAVAPQPRAPGVAPSPRTYGVSAPHALQYGGHEHKHTSPSFPASPVPRDGGGARGDYAYGQRSDNNSDDINNGHNASLYYYAGNTARSQGGSDAALGSGASAHAAASSARSGNVGHGFHTVSLQRGRRKVLCSAEADADEFTVYHHDTPAASERSVVRSTVCMDRRIHERMHDDLRRVYKRINNPESGMPDRGPLFTEAICSELMARDPQAGSVAVAVPPLPPSLPHVLPVPGSATSLSSRAPGLGSHSQVGSQRTNSSRRASRNNSPRLPGGHYGGSADAAGTSSSDPNAMLAKPGAVTAPSSSYAQPQIAATSTRSTYNDLIRPVLHARSYHLPVLDGIDQFIEQEKARSFA